MKVRQVRIGDFTVGIVGLDEIFEEVKSSGESAEDLVKDTIFEKVKAKNYVASAQEDVYREDLYDEYLVYAGLQKNRTRKSGLAEIRVYGAGCPRCKMLDRTMMEIIAAGGLKVDYLYVNDAREIARSGILGTPALTINGKVAAIGNVPPRAQLEKIVLAAVEKK